MTETDKDRKTERERERERHDKTGGRQKDFWRETKRILEGDRKTSVVFL